MKRVYVVVALVVTASAAVAFANIPLPIDVVRSMPFSEYGLISAHFLANISSDHVDTSEYYYNITNPFNYTIDVLVRLSFENSRIYYVQMADGNRSINLERVSKGRTTQYDAFAGKIAPGETRVYKIVYSAKMVPQVWSSGLWGLRYSYTSSMPFQLIAEESSDGTVHYLSFEPTYYGSISLNGRPKDVACSGCNYDEFSSTAEVRGANFFSLSWTEPRTPVVSGVFYLVIVLGIFAYILRMRKVH